MLPVSLTAVSLTAVSLTAVSLTARIIPKIPFIISKRGSQSMSDSQNAFLSFLYRLDDADWKKVVDELQWAIHPVDQRATRIWFAFFPVKLHRALADSPDPAETERRLLLKGRYSLADQVDSSAEFMYGHRYWPDVKRAVAEYVGQILVCPSPVQATDRQKPVPLAAKHRDVVHKDA